MTRYGTPQPVTLLLVTRYRHLVLVTTFPAVDPFIPVTRLLLTLYRPITLVTIDPLTPVTWLLVTRYRPAHICDSATSDPV